MDSQEEEVEEGINWRGYVLIALIVAASFFAGYFINPLKEKWIEERTMPVDECRNSYAPAYASGVHDSVIQAINSFISNCTPSNPEAFIMLNPSTGNIDGTLMRCNSTQGNMTYFPLKYDVVQGR